MRAVRLLILGSFLVGCSRQDTECLARLGNHIAEHARQRADEIGGKVDTGFKSARGAAVLRDRVQQRLRWDRALAESAIEVQVRGSEVELRGTVKTLSQRQRAVELAETAVGVEKVTDGLQVAEP